MPTDVEFELIKGKPPRIFNRLFAFIEHIYGRDCKRDWILGNISPYELIQKVKEHSGQEQYAPFFKHEQEKNLIFYGAELILLPEKLTALTQLNQEGFTVLKQCKAAGLKIGILSNWDPESFVLIKDKFSELFSLCDEIIIPAHVGFIKPDAELFTHVITISQLPSDQLIFIDDSITNVNSAKALGFKTVHHKNWQRSTEELIKSLSQNSNHLKKPQRTGDLKEG